MTEIYGWVRSVVYGICLLELLYHIVQNQDYKKYLRFFGGIIFLLIAVEPLLRITEISDILEGQLQRTILKEEGNQMAEMGEALGDLQNQKIENAYIKELERQIRELLKEEAMEVKYITVSLDPDSPSMEISEIRIAAEGEPEGGTANVRNQLSALYGIERSSIEISISNGGR